MSESFGAMPEVRELPEPTPGDGEVKIEVQTSSLNGFDAKLAGGFLAGEVEHQFPVVLGRDFAGIVTEIGPGVRGFMPGEKVFGVVAKPGLGDGSFGEYVVVPEEMGLAPLPAGLDYRCAGVLGLAGIAALASVDAVGPGRGETLLISGATGGVGHYAVQLATARGATVIATAEAGPAADLLHELGAAHTVDHRADLAAQVRRLAPDGVDNAIHLAGDPEMVADLVTPGGRFASTVGVDAEQLGDRELNVSTIEAIPDRIVLDHIATEAAADRLRPSIARTYLLDEVPQAFTDFNNSGTVGKLAVAIGSAG
ncbi:NADP-dependent oxidoreductase [Micromonospora sp. WMMD1102]|uniref:NADP-dependent oxidoreductase n=1 Tax=Micromonospora sp. WMMD1102 TaxID=3016105 RepID=UPI0024151D33|nr:NADP-dependent oxidoreductase [Micromonospora sp. WMMD1102]MDG4790110.1 NADP-dependent oxidoreductase [Micromonospora sp. WMMD1102]